MPKMHQGSVIDDNFIVVKIIVVTFLDFPDPGKPHQALAIDDFFTSFVDICPSRIFLMPKRINYLLNLYANNLRKPNRPSANANEDWRSTTVVFVWFLYLLGFFLMSNLSALGSIQLSILNSGVKVFLDMRFH
jgi:hypothetical protein